MQQGSLYWTVLHEWMRFEYGHLGSWPRGNSREMGMAWLVIHKQIVTKSQSRMRKLTEVEMVPKV